MLAKLGVFFQLHINRNGKIYIQRCQGKNKQGAKKVVNMPKFWVFFYIQKVQ